MLSGRQRCTQWLAPLPEEDYLRILYIGKLQISTKLGTGCEKVTNSTSIEDMINEIWEHSSEWNVKNGISGHLAYTNEFHISQLIEGKAEEIKSLMSKIRKDPRVVIQAEFQKKLDTMNPGWNVSKCYSFQITTDQYQLIADDDISLEQMFNSMKNTCVVRREGWKLNEFYKTIVDTFLLKYISIADNAKFKRF